MTEIKLIRDDDKATKILAAVAQIDAGVELAPVVRCKDCKYYYRMECVKPENVGTYWDEEAYDTPCYITVELDHFCSYGERKGVKNGI